MKLSKLMKIQPAKIGLTGTQPIRIMDLHGTADMVAKIVDGQKSEE